ncbi:uncharacterized protein [Musca autumnalis]|uniref:uncharacterized protein n=1 Tax=Musca autumnalis TaxID=221902 RepID=UPI003CEED87E
MTSVKKIMMFHFNFKMDGMKKPRCPRASMSQHAALLSFLESEKGLAEGKFAAMHGKETARKKWQEISEELNKIPGAVKTSEQWQTVWRDLKSKTSSKFKTLKRERNATGNRPLTKGFLNPIEERVVGIVGWDYMMGNEECPDSLEIEVAKDLNALLNDDTVQDDRDIFEVEALGDEIEVSPSQNAPKHSTDRISNVKRLKKDNNKEEFLKIAKTQADALLILANAQKETAQAMVKISENFAFLGEILASQNRIENCVTKIERRLRDIGE